MLQSCNVHYDWLIYLFSLKLKFLNSNDRWYWRLERYHSCSWSSQNFGLSIKWLTGAHPNKQADLKVSVHFPQNPLSHVSSRRTWVEQYSLNNLRTSWTWILNWITKMKMIWQGIYLLYSFPRSISFLMVIVYVMDPNRPRFSRRQLQRVENIRHVLFEAYAYDMWMKKKFKTGFKGSTNSDMAEVVVHTEWLVLDSVSWAF